MGGLAFGLASAGMKSERHAAARQDATPTIASAGDPFLAFLGLVPDPYPAATTRTAPLCHYADVAGQLAAVGLSAPTDPESEAALLWQRVTLGLILPTDIFSSLSLIDWEETFGWSPYQIDQSLWFGDPPEVVNLLRGRFDAAAIEAALLKLDYRPHALPGAAIAYSIEHKELDLDDPVERILSLSSLRTLAILPDGTFVWGQRPWSVRAVAAVAAGDRSLRERTPVASLLAAVEAPLASSMLVPGLALQGVPFDPREVIGAAQTPEAVDDLATAEASVEAELQTMPSVGFTLMGIDYGGEFLDLAGTPVALPVEAPPDRIRIYLQFANRDDAATAVPVIERRLATGSSQRAEVPWTTFFRGWEIWVVADRPVVRVALDVNASRNLWYNLLFNRDLGFLAW
jgi:hypothetical protein